MDITNLGIKVDSTDTVGAAKDLDKLTDSAKKTDKAVGDLGNASNKTGKSLDSMSQNVEKVEKKSRLAGEGIGLVKDALIAAAAAAAAYITIDKSIETFIDNTIEAQNMQAQLAAALNSTRGASGQTLESLNKQSEALSRLSIYQDDAISGAQSILLTFTKIGKDVFPQATEAVANVATRMGGDLKGAALQVGKALNDPIMGVSALARAGIQFTESQKEMIKSMVEGGNVLGAQTLILKELENQFGGSAKAARDTLGGAIASLKNSFGDMFEITTQGSEGLRKAIEDLISAFQDPAVKDFVQAVGVTLFNAIGYLIDGFALLVRAIPPIAAALEPLVPLMLAVFGPIALQMVADLLSAGIVPLTKGVIALWGVLAANPITAVVGALVIVLGYFVDWQKSIAAIIRIWELFKVAWYEFWGDEEGKKRSIEIGLNADKISAELVGKGQAVAQAIQKGFAVGGDDAGGKIADAMDKGGKKAAETLQDAQAAAQAHYDSLNGKTITALGNTMVDGGKYVYNQVTGSFTKGGDDAGNKISKAMIAAGSQVAATISAREATIQANQARQNATGFFESGNGNGFIPGGSGASNSLGFIPGGSNVPASQAMRQRGEAIVSQNIADRQRANINARMNSNLAPGTVTGTYTFRDQPGPTGGFADGGSFTVPGNGGGTDSKVVSFRATPGEQVTVSTNNGNQNSPNASDRVQINNFLSPEDMLAAMSTQAGASVITNIIRSDPRKFRAILGVN